MRGQVPDHIDVLLEKPQVDPDAAGIKNLPQFTALDDLLDLVDRPGIFEGMADHEDPLLFLGQVDQFQAAVKGMGHGLLDHHVLALGQKIPGNGEMVSHRGGDHDPVQVFLFQEFAVIHLGFDRGVKVFHPLQTGFGKVAADHFPHLVGLDQIADQVRPPITTTDNSNSHCRDSFC